MKIIFIFFVTLNEIEIIKTFIKQQFNIKSFIKIYIEIKLY